MKEEHEEFSETAEPAQVDASGATDELDETELDDVAGGVAWHWTPENQPPSRRWDKDAQW